MKAHSRVDDASGLVHHVHCTPAHVADVTQEDRLLHGEEDTVCGDSGYTGADKREEFQQIAAVFLIAARPSQVRAIKNRKDCGVAARWQTVIARLGVVVHPFWVIKRQLGDSKVRKCGLTKTSAQVLTLFALSNLWMVRRHLLLQTGALWLEGGKPPVRHHLLWDTHLDRRIFRIVCESVVSNQ